MEVKRIPVKEQTYNIIKEKIHRQDYSFGDRLNINAIAQEINVSATPVREAIAMLERDGLVEVTPNVGPKVIDMPEKLFKDYSKTFVLLANGAYESCIETGNHEKLAKAMERKLAAQEKLVKKGDIYDFSLAAIDFDYSFFEFSEDECLKSVFDHFLIVFTAVVIFDYKNHEISKESKVLEHKAMLEAVQKGDVDEVRRMIRMHSHI